MLESFRRVSISPNFSKNIVLKYKLYKQVLKKKEFLKLYSNFSVNKKDTWKTFYINLSILMSFSFEWTVVTGMNCQIQRRFCNLFPWRRIYRCQSYTLWMRYFLKRFFHLKILSDYFLFLILEDWKLFQFLKKKLNYRLI